MSIGEFEMLDMLNFIVDSEVIEREKWERICAVFWIRGLDLIMKMDSEFAEYVSNGANYKTHNFQHLYSEANVSLLVNDISEAPIWKSFGIDRGVIRYFSEVFLYSVVMLSGNNFGYGFGGIEKMKSSILPEV